MAVFHFGTEEPRYVDFINLPSTGYLEEAVWPLDK